MRGVSMPFLKNKTLLSIVIASLILSPAAMSGVSDLKLSGSAKGYNLIEDSISSSRTNPGFVTNSLGSDNYSPKISLNSSRGKPTAIDLTNGTGSPAINLSRTSGYNGNISSLSSTKKKDFVRYHNWSHKPPTTMKSTSTHICALSSIGSGDANGNVGYSGGYWYLNADTHYISAVCWER